MGEMDITIITNQLTNKNKIYGEVRRHKTSVKKEERSPTTLIGRELPSAVLILRLLSKFLTLKRGTTILVIWLEVPELQ
jgi:hypothetical protein